MATRQGGEEAEEGEGQEVMRLAKLLLISGALGGKGCGLPRPSADAAKLRPLLAEGVRSPNRRAPGHKVRWLPRTFAHGAKRSWHMDEVADAPQGERHVFTN